MLGVSSPIATTPGAPSAEGRPTAGIRALAAASLLATVAGVAAMLVAAANTPGYRWEDYLSEMGVPGQPASGTYQLGLWLIALGVVLLGTVLRPVGALVPMLACAAFVVGSAAVPCSPGCPVPPRAEGVTAQDVAHVAVSAAALAAASVGILLIAAGQRWTGALAALSPSRTAVGSIRTGSAVAVALTAGGMAVTAVALLVSGHGLVHGVVERVSVGVALCWLFAVSLRIAVVPRSFLEQPHQPG
jgi:hypothetical protein